MASDKVASSHRVLSRSRSKETSVENPGVGKCSIKTICGVFGHRVYHGTGTVSGASPLSRGVEYASVYKQSNRPNAISGRTQGLHSHVFTGIGPDGVPHPQGRRSDPCGDVDSRVWYTVSHSQVYQGIQDHRHAVPGNIQWQNRPFIGRVVNTMSPHCK